MPSKLHTFAAALEALCRKHGVQLTGDVGGRINVWPRDEDAKPADLFDRLLEDAPATTKPLPRHFETLIEARARPGFISHELSRRDAEQMSQQHPGEPGGADRRLPAPRVACHDAGEGMNFATPPDPLHGRSIGEPRPCWYCHFFDGALDGNAALCSHARCPRVRSGADHGCCSWEREPGADDDIPALLRRASGYLHSRSEP